METDIERLVRRLRNNSELLDNPHMLNRVKSNILDIANELEQMPTIASVSGSDPLYELANEIGFENVTEEDLQKVIEKMKGERSDSGAVDTVAAGGHYCISIKALNGKPCNKWCGSEDCVRKSSEGQP